MADELSFNDKTVINGRKEVMQQFSKCRYFTNPLSVSGHCRAVEKVIGYLNKLS